jgi:hypothetical protein
MNYRLELTRFLAFFVAVSALCVGSNATAAPLTYFVTVDTSPANGFLAGTQGSLEFQFASSSGLSVGNATLSHFTGGSFPVGGMTTVFTGSSTGSLTSGTFSIFETPPSAGNPTGNAADVAVDFNYGNSFSFQVTLSEPGAFNLLLWNAPGGNGSTLLTLTDLADSFGNGPALALTVPARGPQTVEAAAGVTVLTTAPEPSSFLIFGGALVVAGAYRRVRSRRVRRARTD